MEPVDRANRDLSGLVDELDVLLAGRRSGDGSAGSPVGVLSAGRVPRWIAIPVVVLLGVAVGFAVVQPWQQRCSYGRDLCEVAELDIDALRITIPDSALISRLADIDALDPDDRLTAGDIFAMQPFRDEDVHELLTEAEVQLLLEVSRGR